MAQSFRLNFKCWNYALFEIYLLKKSSLKNGKNKLNFADDNNFILDSCAMNEEANMRKLTTTCFFNFPLFGFSII